MNLYNYLWLFLTFKAGHSCNHVDKCYLCYDCPETFDKRPGTMPCICPEECMVAIFGNVDRDERKSTVVRKCISPTWLENYTRAASLPDEAWKLWDEIYCKYKTKNLNNSFCYIKRCGYDFCNKDNIDELLMQVTTESGKETSGKNINCLKLSLFCLMLCNMLIKNIF